MYYIIPTLQMRGWKFRQVEQFTQGHTLRKQWNRVLHPSKLSVDPLPLITTLPTHSSPRAPFGLLSPISDTHQEENNSCGHDLAPLCQVLSWVLMSSFAHAGKVASLLTLHLLWTL